MPNPAMTQTRVRLLYRAISMALISSILATPVALFISYKFSKARYDRIVERQVDDFRQILFRGDFGPDPKSTISDRVTSYLDNTPRRQEKDASLVYISIVDEFGQKVADQNYQSSDGRRFRTDDITLCLNSFIPILSFGGERYFCTRVDLSNGRSHYGFFGILRVSYNVISDFIANSVIMCLFTFLFAIAVSALQYYISLKVSKTLIKANVRTLFLLGNTIALRDNDTFHHNLRVMIYSYYLGKTSGISDEKLNDLINGALLHDIGKIGIPDAVLQKPGKLTPEEFDIIKGHVGLGEKIMVNSEWIDRAVDVIRHHHERYDGTGYPDRLSGEDIPIIARIFAIVDVFDALTSRRPYKEPCSYEETMAYIVAQKGKHFDASLVEAFMEISRMLYNNYANREDDTIVAKSNSILNEYYS